MAKYTVHFMTSFCSWEDVEAESEEDAIAQCSVPNEHDANDPTTFVAICTDEEFDLCATTPDYWDCNCDENYIHKKTHTLFCDKCGAKEEDQPDSRINEVRKTILSE